jgi:beta-ribofuranosylaminobenzene 5'-phosphate synthase
MKKITVSVPAHLHAGNMDLTGDLGRLYGTAGFVLKHPRTVITAEKASKTTASGEDADSAKSFAQAFIKKFRIPGGVRIQVKESIPKNVGMGSQTALALSTASAIAGLYQKKISLEEAALALGRSDIVALGFYGFSGGGFIVDGGYRIREKGKRVPPLLFRRPIPEDWRFVVCIPVKPLPAIMEIKADEDRILSELKKMPAEVSDRLSRIMLMQAMPAMAEGDIRTFGKAVTDFNSRLGGFWDDYQKGRIYCHPLVEDGVKLLMKSGAFGVCQTCWGPTFYGIFDDSKKAKQAAAKVKAFIDKNGGGSVFVTAGDNVGARVRRW